MSLETNGADGPQPCGCRVLIVDDNLAAAWVLGRVLTLLDSCEVQSATSGEHALELMRQNPYDVVMLDIALPRMDGYAVCREIRSHEQYDGVLLVTITGYGRQEDRERSAAAGFDLHLLKPASIEDLKGMLAHPKLADGKLANGEKSRATLEPARDRSGGQDS